MKLIKVAKIFCKIVLVSLVLMIASDVFAMPGTDSASPGVTVDNGSVVSIKLRANNFEGYISESIGGLNLCGNQLEANNT